MIKGVDPYQKIIKSLIVGVDCGGAIRGGQGVSFRGGASGSVGDQTTLGIHIST